MGKNRNWWWLLWMGLLVLLLAGCMGKEEQWLQGRWTRGNTHFVSEWSFNSGNYSSYYDYTNNINPRSEEGHYTVVESGEDYIVIELFNRKGTHPELLEEYQRIRFKINVEADTIEYHGQVFERVVR